MENIWETNKVKCSNGTYKYKCMYTNCSKPRIMHKSDDINYNTSIYSEYCAFHYKKLDMKNILIIY